MKQFLLSVSILCVSAGAAFAAVEPNYAPDKPPVTTPWYASQGAAEQKADLDFIRGMRPHHAGALTMSDEYLADKGASNTHLKQLAKGIKHNQQFEIGMLDRVEQLVGQPIKGEREWRQIAERGLAQKQRFTRAPMPTGFGGGDVSARDVQFAKGMAVHHEAALVMAKDYLSNPHATNKYLRLMCVEILTDQKMEIGFMQDMVEKYKGDADAIKVDMSMIHGMEGMHHGGHHAPAPKKAKIAPKSPAKPTAHEGHEMGHH